MKIRTRVAVVVVIIGIGLIIGGQITPGEAVSATRPAGDVQQDVYFLVPTTVSVSISSLNGTGTLTVSPLSGNLANQPPIVNVSVVQKDIVTFSVRSRGYYALDIVNRIGHPIAVTYTLTEAGQPSDVSTWGIAVMGIGLVCVGLLSIKRRQVAAKARSLEDR